MFATMSTHYVTALPHTEPELADIHLDMDIADDTPRSCAPLPVEAQSTSVDVEMDIQPAEHATESIHQVLSPPTEGANLATVENQVHMNAVETAPDADKQSLTPASTDPNPESVGTQKVDTGEGIPEADDHAFVLKRPRPVSPIPTDVSTTIYTVCKLSQDAASGATGATGESTSAIATAVHENVEEEPVPTSAEPKDIESETAQVEIHVAEVEKSDIFHPELIEAGISEAESVKRATTALADENTVVATPDLLAPETPMSTSSNMIPSQCAETETVEQHMSNKFSEEDMLMTDDPHQHQDHRRPTTPACEPVAADDTSSETSNSSDTNEQVAWLQRNANESYGEGHSSEKEAEKVQGESATNTQRARTAPDTSTGMDGKDLVEDNHTAAKTSDFMPTERVEPATVTVPYTSLFGGPWNPEPTIQPEISKATDARIDFAASAASEGETTTEHDPFREPQDVPVGLTRGFLEEQALGGDIAEYGEWDFDTQPDMEADTEAGAEQGQPSPAYDSDQDAKPDMGATTGNVSPAASQVSQVSAAQTKDIVDFITSETQYPPNPNNADTEILDLLSEDTASGLGQSMLQSASLESHCDCNEYPCAHDLNLRPKRKEGNPNYGNHIIDNDNTGDYEDDPNGTSASRIAREDMDEDESDNDDAEDHVMSGGLNKRAARVGDLFKEVPYNQRDSCIRDKNALDDESSDDEVIDKPKKRKRAKQVSSRPSKKAKSNKPTIKRSSESDDDDLITTQDDNGEIILTKEIKKRPKSRTITQIMQRLATPKTTKLSYPITFNSSQASCSLCNQRTYAFSGCGSRNVNVYDYGHGLIEIPNANEAGLPISMKRKPASTNLCMACTTQKMAILMCKKHSMVALDPVPDFDKAAAFNRLIANEPATETEVWCSICPSPALHGCSKDCGAKFCETCAIKVHTEYHENLQAMLEATKDEVTPEYRIGLRADVALLRGDGELAKFMKRHSKANRTA
ncbi:hypothetical protein E4T39_05657 [Aureobasidium subglaciale]|nr:hypothetical protein E4T39_05657 [Aureobasidium subglaciale]